MSDVEIGSKWREKADGDVRKIVKVEVAHDGGDDMVWVDSRSGNGRVWIKRSDFLARFDPVPEMVNEQGRKDDSAKRRYSLLPTGTVNSVVDVLEFGSQKYADNNWQKVPNARTRYYDAALRHIDAWYNGELRDSETGLPHLAHAICCLMFLMWFDSEEHQ